MKKASDVHQIISKKHSCNEQGITLVALIVTIIVLLILSGITIASFKQSNIITRARSSAKRYSASQIDEKIDMAQQNLVAEREGYDYSIKDLVDEVKKENKDIDTIFVDESNNGRKATYIIDDYFYDFTKKDDGIIVYNRKADASDKDKEKYENKKELKDLKSGIITFKNDKTDWTNENVNVTIVAKAEDKSIQEKIDNGTYFVVSTVNDATKLTTLTKSITSQVATNQGDTIYACLTDGYGTYVATATEKIENIDKTAPTDAKPIAKTTTNSITATNNQEDKPGTTETKASGIAKTEYSKDGGKTWQASNVFSGLTQNTTYYVQTKVTDNAGNTTTSEVATAKTTIVPSGTTSGVITLTPDHTTWTNTDVKVTATTNQTGYTIQMSTDGKTFTDGTSKTLTSNGTVYARLRDSSNNYGACATISISIIDKVAPTKPTYKAFYDDGKTTYTSGTWTNQHVKTDISSIDANSGINRIEYSFDKNSWNKFQFELSNGLHQNGTTTTGTESWGLTNRNDTVYFRAIDNAGNISEVFDSFNIRYDVTAPTSTSATITNVTSSGYDVYIYGVSDNASGINRVQFPTWTNSNDQDDIQSNWWSNSSATGTRQSDGTTWYYRVNITDHKNESGVYNTHIYGYDNAGNQKCLATLQTTVPAPPLPTTTNYTGCYADVNDDGTVDGVIFIDLAQGASGIWSTGNGIYSYSAVTSGLRSYKTSTQTSSYTGNYGTKPVIAPNGKSGSARFYVMALSDFDSSTHAWSDACSKKQIVGNVTFRLPSKEEWSAFGGQFGITTSNYSSSYGLSSRYWSPTEYEGSRAWVATFCYGYMAYGFETDNYSVRLCATF